MAEQTNQNLTREEQQVFEDLDKQLSTFRTAKTSERLDAADLCDTYHKIKPILKLALPIIRKFVPVIGDRIADAIEFLMTIADGLCPEG